MKISNIEWISKDALEAIVTVTDGIFECIAFSQPCFYNINDHIKLPLMALDTYGFMKEDKKVLLSIKKHNHESQFFYQDITGVLKIGKNNIVKVGDIEIEITDSIPSDILDNEIVSFSSSRIDLV